MQDRIPALPGRVKMTMPDGTVQYVVLERADEPTQVGTPLNKATLLKDTTAQIIGLTQEDPTVDDALFALRAMASDKGFINLSVKTAKGNPFPAGLPISGVQNLDGTPFVTTGAAVNLVQATPGSVTLSTVAYADMAAKTMTITVAKGSIQAATFQLPAATAGQKVFTSSGSIIFSPMATEMDICAVGAGGGGGMEVGYGRVTGWSYVFEGSGGGGGYVTNVMKYIIKAAQSYTVTVGAGGKSGSKTYDNNSNLVLTQPTNGGASSVKVGTTTVANANGGNGAVMAQASSSASNTPGTGNGNGGQGGQYRTNGSSVSGETAATVGGDGVGYKFNDSSLGLAGGGGGAGGNASVTGQTTVKGGAPNGGSQNPDTRGPGGGGAGQSIYGDGFRGEVTIRWRVRGDI